MGLLNDVNNPHVLGLDAREIFFLEDRVILVEGQEDVIFYQAICEQLTTSLNGTFFGWGVGGAEKMPIIAQMLKDLGFERIVGILDGNRKNMLPDLQKQFPEFNFFSIPVDDVRTKEPRSAKDAVEGLVDRKGFLQDQYKDIIRNLIVEINMKLDGEV